MRDQGPTFDAAEVARILVEHDAENALPCDPDPVVNGLHLRRDLGRKQWAPAEEFGCCGWIIHGVAGGYRSTVRVSGDHQSDSVNWIHASIGQYGHMPSYEDLQLLHRAVFRDGWAYEVFAPSTDHINIHSFVRHLFGRADGARALPDFGRFGTI
jgi:hypothetical protein